MAEPATRIAHPPPASATRDARAGTVSLRGLPILEQLDHLNVTSLRLVAALVVLGAALTGGLSLLLASAVSAHSANPVSLRDVAFSVFNGAFAGANIGLAVASARHLEDNVCRALAHDPMVADHFAHPPDVPRGRFLALFVMVVFVAQAWYRLFGEITATLAAGVETTRILYVLAPMALNFLAGGLLVIALGYGVLLQRGLARRIEPDLRRVQQYACFALPALYLFGLYSIILGAATASVVLFEGTGEIMPAYLQRTTFMVVIFLPFVLSPLREIHRSIERSRNAERERVVRALDGDAEALRESVVDRGGPDRSEWMSHLLWLDALPTWPLGPYLQRFLLFVLLPPVTWVMAAAVENLLF